MHPWEQGECRLCVGSIPISARSVGDVRQGATAHRTKRGQVEQNKAKQAKCIATHPRGRAHYSRLPDACPETSHRQTRHLFRSIQRDHPWSSSARPNFVLGSRLRNEWSSAAGVTWAYVESVWRFSLATKAAAGHHRRIANWARKGGARRENEGWQRGSRGGAGGRRQATSSIHLGAP